MRSSTESVVNKLVNSALKDFKVAIPAKVVGVSRLKDGFIDVQPIVKYQNRYTLEYVEYPVIHDVRVIFPSTKKSTICFPIEQDDHVELVFQSANIQKFVDGSTEVHRPYLPNFDNLSDVVAYVGFTPYQESCFNANNYSTEFNLEDLNIVHNKGQDNEVTFRLKDTGDVVINTPKKIEFNCTEFEVTATEKIKFTAPLISENGR